MRNKLVLIAMLFTFSSTLVLGLYLVSDHLNHRHNNFTRLFPPHIALQEKILDIHFNSYHIAGLTRDHIYLGNETAPLLLLTVNASLSDTQHLSITDVSDKQLKSGSLSVDSPYFYLADRITHCILRGNLGDLRAGNYMDDSIFFDQAVSISKNSFAIRTLKQHALEYELGKESLYQPHVKTMPGLLEKQVDGMFCTDGIFSYDNKNALLIYLYYYRNQYICMDTNLHLLYRGKTIDTVSQAKIKVARIKSDNSFTLAEPPVYVNKNSCAWNNTLFVYSGLMANNEKKEEFDKVSVIDAYDLLKKTYKFSFYLSDYKNQKIKSFRIFENSLIAIYDHYLVTYKLSSSFFYN